MAMHRTHYQLGFSSNSGFSIRESPVAYQMLGNLFINKNKWREVSIPDYLDDLYRLFELLLEGRKAKEQLVPQKKF